MECGSPCTKTCDNYDEVSICAAVCQSGCFCPEGTVEHKDRCMSVEQCPRDCNGGKEWQECGTACPLTCDNYKNLLVCTLQCVQGCFCPRGKVDLNGVCVNKTTCAGETEFLHQWPVFGSYSSYSEYDTSCLFPRLQLLSSWPDVCRSPWGEF